MPDPDDFMIPQEDPPFDRMSCMRIIRNMRIAKARKSEEEATESGEPKDQSE